VFGAIAGVTAFGTLSGLAVQAASAAPTGNNLAGADRYQTAGNLNAAKFGAAGIGTVLLADAIPGTPGSGAGGHQSDALAVSGYAGLNHDGLLLTDTTNTVPANTMSALSTLKVKNVIAVGGSAAISSAQVAQLTAAGYTVTQPFAGADRYATMQMIDNSFTPSTVGKDPSGNNTAILASGDYAHLVDALAAGGLAYAKKFPVILTPTGSTTLGSQASSEISSLQIKHLIVVGGTASIPSSQYTPNPSGVTTVDVLSGADRSATSEAIEKAAVGTYGFAKTKLGIAAGATFVGSTSQVQNDGADALSSAPYLGDPEPMCVTNGPTDVGSAAKCVSDVNPTTVDWLTGTANLPASQQSTILAGGTSTSPNAYTVSGGSLALKASTATAPSQGTTTYTVSGLPTAAGTVANVALFPIGTGAKTACGVGFANGGPSTSGTSATFTPPCSGTTAAAGTVAGEGATSSNSTGALGGANAGFAKPGGGAVVGSPASELDTAYIASVNGVPTTLNANGDGPTIVYQVTPSNGALSFVVNSFQLDGAVPVVYTAPSSAGTTPPLVVNADGTPSSGYAVGVGGPSAWGAPAAPAATAAQAYTVDVVLAPPLSGSTTFDGVVVGGGPPGTLGNIYSFDFSPSGSTFNYTDATPMAMTAFTSDLSALAAGVTQPNSTTVFQSGNNPPSGGVNGDIITIGTGTGYAAGTPSNFKYLSDVPAAPTNVAATYNACAFNTGTCTAGVVVTWTPPANADVSGAQATQAPAPADYEVWRSTVSGGTLGAATALGVVHVSTAAVTAGVGGGDLAGGPTPIASPEFIDPTFSSGGQYVYYVTATAATASGGTPGGSGAATNYGPFSTGSPTVTAGAAAAAPTMKFAVVTPSTAFTAFNGNTGTGTFTSSGGAPGSLTITYSSAVSCLAAAGADFSYSNSGGSGAVAGTQCWQVPGNPTQLVIALAQTAKSGSGSTATFTATTVANPGNGDTVTYTPGSPQTTANSVFAGPASGPAYAASGTLTGNGTGAASTSNPVGTGTGAPLMGSATHTAGTVVITYNQDVTCAVGAAADFSGTSTGGTPTACARTAANQLTLTVPAGAAGSLTYTSPASPTAANAVNDNSAHTEFSPGSASDTQTITVA